MYLYIFTSLNSLIKLYIFLFFQFSLLHEKVQSSQCYLLYLHMSNDVTDCCYTDVNMNKKNE